MKNSLTATLLAFALAMFVAPAQASVHITEPSVETFATSQLPSFIPGNPVALTEQGMKEVRGEVLPWLVVYGLYYTGVAAGIAWYRLYPYAVWCTQNCTSYWEMGNVYSDALAELRN